MKAALTVPTLEIILGDGTSCRGTAVALIFNRAGEIVVGQRTYRGWLSHTWELAQGGIDWGETALAAAIRESGEELGLPGSSLLHLGAVRGHPHYILPRPDLELDFRANILACSTFLLRENTQINLNSGLNGETPEFGEYQWMPLHQLARKGPAHKRTVYSKIAEACLPISQALKCIAHQDMSDEKRAAFVQNRLRLFRLSATSLLAANLIEFSGHHKASRIKPDRDPTQIYAQKSFEIAQVA